MTTATVKKELEELKERQIKLEQAFYQLFGNEAAQEEEIRPSYLKKLEKIRKNMEERRGITVIRSKSELRKFFRSL